MVDLSRAWKRLCKLFHVGIQERYLLLSVMIRILHKITPISQCRNITSQILKTKISSKGYEAKQRSRNGQKGISPRANDMKSVFQLQKLLISFLGRRHIINEGKYSADGKYLHQKS
uniref:Uncharacterized protein LOC105129541 n=1 Tax=Rhizophora mucronata TaxID=61149 RepID=A0A2P2J6P8_RHIMU